MVKHLQIISSKESSCRPASECPFVVDSDDVRASLSRRRDCMGCAKTGSGKTAAFVLPILQKLSEDPFGIFCLVLTPTRELAYQIAEQFRVLGKPLGLKDCIIVGGMGMY
ncbi:hypothetical protein AB205_0085130 [Aquarana catesbeiana]|uniref:Helicase ATP-binding domain-containing protein n=1 Tax=Aquarana catesbeiana TaxID=8400 RepID=A0A2G9RA09_AQUCT|nr:hypothetical protein AB205_0085130 [Aquarana catesbeiana]